MNQVVYNNRVFYFDSKKYSVDHSKQYNKSCTNKENSVINLIIKVSKHKKEVPAAGKGYVAARFLKNTYRIN